MIFILFERQIFVVSVAFSVTKIHLVVSSDIGFFFFLVTSPVNIFECYSFYFPGDFPGLNIKSFRDLLIFISHESSPSWLVFDCFRRSGFLSIYNVLSRFASVRHQHSLDG